MLPCECVLPYGFLSCSVVVPNNRAQNSAYKNLLSIEKITTLEQRKRDVARGLYFIETQGVYEIRLGYMSMWPCKSARRFANLQTALHINKGLLHICSGLCTHAAPDAYVQSGVQICKTVCCYAAPRVHVQQRVPMCTAVCLFAGRDARVHNSLFICSAPCMYARRRVHSQKAVYMCRASCLFADVCACVQSGVLICTSTCTRARFTGSLSAQIESASRPLGGGDLSTRIAPRKSPRGF